MPAYCLPGANLVIKHIDERAIASNSFMWLMQLTWLTALEVNVRLANAGRICVLLHHSPVGRVPSSDFMQGTCNFTLQSRSELLIK